jgi:hypothetical protein
MRLPGRLLAAVVLGWPAVAAAGDGFDFVVPGLQPPGAPAEPVIRDSLSPGPLPPGPWDPDFRPGRESLRGSGQVDGFFGSLTGQQTVREGNTGIAWDDPLAKRGWQADQAWKMSLAGPLYAYGQFSASAEEALQQDARVNGRTGLAFQVPIPTVELLLRGGPTLACSDPLRPERMKEKSELLLEVQGRCPLLFGVHLEYQGSACPAVSPLERDWVSQELRLALPVGPGGTFKLGARQRWDNVAEQKSTTEGAELFLGLELKH